jgi:phage protein D
MYNFVSVDFPNADEPPIQVLEMHLWQARYKHDFATFTFRDWTPAYNNIRPGTPMQFTLHGDNTEETFNGYVHHIKPKLSPGKNYVEVHFIGASYYLKQTSQKTYKGRTASEIVIEIAKRNNFAYRVEPHPRVYDQISQAGLTDMEMINKLAKQCGYSVRFKNAEIHFQPVLKLYENERENAQILMLRDSDDPAGSTLYSFDPLIGESLEHDGEYKSATAISGVDAFTGKVIQVTNQTRPKATKKRFEPEFFDRFSTITVANNYKIAKSESESADQRTRFPYRAKAEALGDPGLHPDAPVYIDGVNEEYAGFWVILTAEHKLTSTGYTQFLYTTELTLGTDSLGGAVAGVGNKLVKSPNLKPKRTIIPNVRQTNKKPKTTLKAGSLSQTKNAQVGFGAIKNRSKPKTANQVIIGKKWVSPSGNLAKVTKTKSRSKTVVKKLRSKGVL